MQIVTDREMLIKKCKEVKKDKLSNILNEMEDLMNEMCGVGIAAPQVGLLKRFFLARLHNDNGLGGVVKVFINPVITEYSEEMVDDMEGCLSIPDQGGTVSRHKSVTISYHNGVEDKVETYSDFDARIIQHEFDHLEGILYIDRVIKMFERDNTESKVVSDEN